jgi:hypothetical protein
MKLLLPLLCLLAISMTASANDWMPPANPDVDAIRDEAEADAKAGRYELALAKHVWWHENVNKYKPSMSGVRLSFALGDWHRLGEVYPPALAKLKETRDRLADSIMSEVDKKVSFEDFHEFTAINRELEETEKTVQLFKFVVEKNPEAADRVFGVSEKALIKAKEYALCGKYLDPERSVDTDLMVFNFKEPRIKPEHADLVRKSRDRRFINEAATLVALLVINDRKDEAQKAVEKYKTVKADAEFHQQLATALDSALEGKLPERS